jgi:hypothetical protein
VFNSRKSKIIEGKFDSLKTGEINLEFQKLPESKGSDKDGSNRRTGTSIFICFT